MHRYLPEAAELDRLRFPMEGWSTVFERLRVEPVPIAHDCTDGFFGAYWRRPWAYIDPRIRAGLSILRQLDARTVERALAALKDDLESGAWEELVGKHLPIDSLDLGYRMVIADLDGSLPSDAAS
jgi:hypothetical protein